MENIGLNRVKKSDVDQFTTETGIKVRRIINPLLRKILKLATKREIILESYPDLKKDTPYIFASSHSFDEDIISALSTIDRNAYALIGTTNQIEQNPQLYAAWLNGMIYVDRLDAKSRKESVKKMERIINSGSSVLIFPEGGWNNTENLLIQPLFSGPYLLAQSTGAQVVPIASFNESGSNKIHIKFGEPLNLASKDKKEALIELRDSLATMMFEHIEKYSTHLTRKELSENCRLDFMQERKNEYMRVKWTRDTWDEEITYYLDKEHPLPQEINLSFDSVEVNSDNAYVMAPVLVKRMNDEKYNFKNYMHNNYKK